MWIYWGCSYTLLTNHLASCPWRHLIIARHGGVGSGLMAIGASGRYTESKTSNCPLTRDYFNRKYLWTNYGFSGYPFVCAFRGDSHISSLQHEDQNSMKLTPSWCGHRLSFNARNKTPLLHWQWCRKTCFLPCIPKKTKASFWLFMATLRSPTFSGLDVKSHDQLKGAM